MKISEIVENVKIVSESDFEIQGRSINVFQLIPLPESPSSLQAPVVVSHLAKHLYDHFYSVDGDEEPGTYGADPSFLADLKACVPHPAHREEWTVDRNLGNGELVVVRGLKTRCTIPGQYVHLDGPHKVEEGSTIELLQHRISDKIQPGFVHVFGKNFADEVTRMSTLRVYWNGSPRGTLLVLKKILDELDGYKVPFQFKCLSNPAHYKRLDSAVLYVSLHHASITMRLISGFFSDVKNDLGEAVPLFTKQVGRGVAIAEDPKTGESFGGHRCRLIAEGCHDAFRAGADHASEFVMARFAQENLSFDRPYRRTEDVYALDELSL